MPSPSSENALVNLLSQCFVTPKCQGSRIHYRALSTASSARHSRSFQRPRHRQDPRISRRTIHSAVGEVTDLNNGVLRMAWSGSSAKVPHTEPMRIAVLGGGITGLSAAHYLARGSDKVKVTIYEAADRLGGWVHSKYVDVGDGKILFEMGPRTLRPNNGLTTLKMIEDLGIQDQIITSSKNSEAAQNRFIYYPDHLVRLPSPPLRPLRDIWSFLSEELYGGFETLYGIAKEYGQPQRPADLRDESIGSFLARRLGSSVLGDNIVSAGLHGIYAGDINQLSVRSLFPQLWYAEKFYGTCIDRFMEGAGKKLIPYTTQPLIHPRPDLSRETLQKIENASVYSFQNGLETLPKGLEQSLRSNPNVTFKMEEKVTGIEYDAESDGIKIKTARNQPAQKFTHAISTLPGRALSTLLTKPVPALASIHSVTVMVVNLFYTNPDLLPKHGFGYLIPRSIPFDQNPECALGVVFDSDALKGQDPVPGTKVTVMIGGHWWDDFDAYPDEDEGAAMATAVLARHLNITAKPDAIHVAVKRECIPQYTVGHEDRMSQAKDALMEQYKGRLSALGSSFTGVGLNDCVMTAARNLSPELLRLGKARRWTGLEGADGWLEVTSEGKPTRVYLETENKIVSWDKRV